MEYLHYIEPEEHPMDRLPFKKLYTQFHPSGQSRPMENY
jgi:hypothetical protein